MGAVGAKRRERKTLSRNVAVVSIGTNSTRLLVARCDDDGTLEQIVHHSVGTRLGASLKESGSLDPDAVTRTLRVIDLYAMEIAKYGADANVIATSALRRASDAGAFGREVKKRLGASLEILAGRREAELSYRGATSMHRRADDGTIGVLDVGGGSTEYAYGHRTIEGMVSCEIGAVRLSEAIPALLGEVAPADVADVEREAREYAHERLAQLREFPAPKEVLGVGGTLFNAASIVADRDREAIDGVVLTRDALGELARRFLRLEIKRRRQQPRISEQRADIFPAGLLIVDEALGLLGVTSCTISQADLLYGYLVEKYAS